MIRTFKIIDGKLSGDYDVFGLNVENDCLSLKYNSPIWLIEATFENYTCKSVDMLDMSIDLNTLVELRAFCEDFELKVVRKNNHFVGRYRDDHDAIEMTFEGKELIKNRAIITNQYYEYNDNGDIYISDMRFVKVVE